METIAVQSRPEIPAPKPRGSAKREFEKIIQEICRIAASARGLSGQHLEALIAHSQENANKQWYAQVTGSVGQMIFTAAGVAAAVKISPEAFQIPSKLGDIFKGITDANQSTYQMEQQKHQHTSTQWQTWANGLESLVRNLESAKQRLQQLEDQNR